MLNINERMDNMENTEKVDNFEEEFQNPFEVDNSNYKVNYFGLGRGAEDWE
ncbi:hypothetical protein [Clostridium sp. CF012]|uniref:hypothetical protein n=1 Tax=Clostridium sp. CF012 TaxID=2843319 RepID=UPI001C0AA58F|nr:hypothetical protein [Clostridium sp. CF012]MBU3145305.1 hypothetical protein [Clostridium sp. CF012]